MYKMSDSSVKVSLPNNVKKMILNIKEITRNHSDDEIYVMLKECSMDPNETAQKLLLQDPFHEVKRKRDRKKENTNNGETGDSQWRPGTQGRGNKGGRVNYSPRYASHDAEGGRNFNSGRDNGTNQAPEKAVGPSLPASEETSKEAAKSLSLAAVVANGPPTVPSGSAGAIDASSLPVGSVINKNEVISVPVDGNKLVQLVDSEKTPSAASGNGANHVGTVPSCADSSFTVTPTSSSAVCFSPSDPVLVPSNDTRVPGTVRAIKREVGSQRTVGESNAVSPAGKSARESGFPRGRMPLNKSQGIGKSQLTESFQSSSASAHGGSAGSRPSSNYSSRSRPMIGPHRVGSYKEWKPKPTNSNLSQGSGTAASVDAANNPAEANNPTKPASTTLDSEEATTKLQKKLEELHLPRRQHVIIPNHIHVPESERSKLSFGSFDAAFGVTSTYVSGPDSDKSSTPVSKTSQGIEEDGYPDHPESPSNTPENLSGEADVSSSAQTDYSKSKQENASLSGSNQHSIVHTSPNYRYGFVPPMLDSQMAPFENSESQARDVSRIPGFVVQQPFDPASYYAQFCRSGADGDAGVSPFPSPGDSAKYNGNAAVLSPHTSQSPQEGGNSLVVSTTSPTPLVTQAAGLVQSSMAVTQQPVPVFRPPTGLHISHYPPNYIPYGPYFSPFYVPPPGIHQFLSNGVFPQQPQAGNVYPAAPPAAAGIKYPVAQYKPGTNAGNSTHMGMPNAYRPYGSFPAGYNHGTAGAGANSNANEDLATSQLFNDNNVYMSGQQSEGSAVWIAAPGRDLSSLPASSFYNLPPQSQHVTFAPTQAGQGAFAGIYHPAQAVTATAVHPLMQQSQAMAGAVDVVGPAANVYQQPHHQQINWPNSY